MLYTATHYTSVTNNCQNPLLNASSEQPNASGHQLQLPASMKRNADQYATGSFTLDWIIAGR